MFVLRQNNFDGTGYFVTAWVRMMIFEVLGWRLRVFALALGVLKFLLEMVSIDVISDLKFCLELAAADVGVCLQLSTGGF